MGYCSRLIINEHYVSSWVFCTMFVEQCGQSIACFLWSLEEDVQFWRWKLPVLTQPYNMNTKYSLNIDNPPIALATRLHVPIYKLPWQWFHFTVLQTETFCFYYLLCVFSFTQYGTSYPSILLSNIDRQSSSKTKYFRNKDQKIQS